MKYQNNLCKCFIHAYNGFGYAARERNVRFHLVATVVIICISFILELRFLEWAFILSSITLVLITEFINTCIELICDMITTEYSIQVKKIKDIAAASVLISVAYALTIAALILLPKLSIYI